MSVRDEKLSAIRKELTKRIPTNGTIKNVGKVFFSLNGDPGVLKETVYYGSQRHGFDFELFSLDMQSFAGSKVHAQALLEAFGGRVYPSEFCTLADNPKEIYIWEKTPQWDRVVHCYNPNPMEMEAVVEALIG